MSKIRVLIASVAVLAFASRSWSQDFQIPKPGPEHEMLAKLTGDWEVSGAGEGKTTYKMMLGGLWLESTFKGKFGGMDFEGRGLDTYDPAKKKYISVWVDSMGTSPLVLEGTYDKEKKTLTMEGEGPMPDGSTGKYTSVTEYVDDDTTNFTLSAGGQEMVKLTYKRVKTADKAKATAKPKAPAKAPAKAKAEKK